MKRTLLLLFCLFTVNLLFAQQGITVTGKVTDSDNGQGLVGATVQVKGTNQGTQTDANGYYSLTAPATASLLITYLGYEPQEVAISNQTNIAVSLRVSAKQLEQVVVVGYGAQKKADVTGAIETIDAGQVTNRPVSSAMQALKGQVSGVRIQQRSGAPGQAPDILIRGTGSTGNTSPLYVVDGMYVNDIQFLHPSDIASMSVLKDASSLAIYGVRGANGVVIITTKSGRARQTVVTYNAYAGFQYPAKKIRMANATEFATLVNEADANAGRTPTFSSPGSLGEGTDWFDAITRKAFMTDHNLSVSGGSDKGAYSLSASYLKQDGIVSGSGYERFTLRLNNDYKLTKGIRLGNNLSLSRGTSSLVPEGVVMNAYWMHPTVPVRDADGKFGFTTLASVANPVAQLHYNNNTERVNRLTGSVFGEVDLLRHVTFRSNFGTDLALVDASNYVPVYSVSGFQRSLQSNLTKARNESSSWLWENTLTYKHTLADRHNVQALAGYTSQVFKSDLFSGQRQDVPTDPNLYYLSAGTPTGQTVSNTAPEYNAFLSSLLRFNYDYDHKYLLTASFRRDGSSKFAPNYRYGNFGSVGLGWNLDQEGFMKSQGVFELLKLRGSWGVLGNDKIVDNTYYELVNNNYYAVFGPNETLLQGATVTLLANPDVRWERVEMQDAGLEFTTLQNRLDVVVDYYNRTTHDMQVNVPIPSIAGANAPVVNAASVRNRGWEASLKWRESAGSLNYYVGGNITTIHNRVVSLGNGGQPLIGGNLPVGGISVTRTDVGQPIGSFYGYKTLGIFQTQKEIAESPLQPNNPKPGDLRFADINGDKKIDINDRTYLGSYIPKFNYGLSAGLEYKGFDASINLDGVYGNKIYNAKKQFTFGVLNYEASVLGRWHGEGTATSVPKVGTDAVNNYQPSDYFIESGSFLRLNNLQLGYTLKGRLFSQEQESSIRLYASGMNLFTSTKYSGFSPEISGPAISSGFDLAPYPVAASMVFGVNVSF